ncbi:CDP-alcohol phosphatidyltransferase [Streptomyces griseosporeus]|uniref:CDP-alcohol phosphatidyltransferase n=2 Tax=Streptomyces TaxID=1883 RepID=A0A2U9PEI1_STRAS|nr:CDP-alcohol phosphatidyltransferase [Streptomyces actuosus]AWT47575.1 CDP-alcohol phosphatidyltransferase [Streptomyces actuosus]
MASVAVTVLAFALVVSALLLPNKSEQFKAAMFTRIPVEGLLGAAVLIALPRRARPWVAAVAGLGLGVLTVLNLMDVGFNEYLGRSFNVILDWQLLDDAQSYLADTLGGTTALLAAVGVVALVAALLAAMVWAALRVGGLVGRHPARSTRALLLLSAVWMTCSTLDVQFSGIPVASQHAYTMVRYREEAVRNTIRDERAFAKEAKADAFGATPPAQLVPDLRGKDMIFTFIESYGRSAVEDPVMAPGVDRTLDASTQALAKAGFHAKSGWLTSATYGGNSWLGHSTFLSGLWIDNQNRYRTVTSGDHLPLTKVFQKTGAWDTVGVMPGVQKGWPEQKYYGLDKLYDAFDLGYRGPKFSWSTMPDQYALEAFQRLEHGRKRDKPLMSEIILTSSHQPWAPIPKLVGWDELGDGRIFGPIQKAGNDPRDIVTDSQRSKEEYGKTIQYSVTSLTQWLTRYGTDDTVLVFLGDHQPIARVSGNHASRDVPVAIVAKDPKVLEKIAGWKWSDGLRPAHDAPVWKMDAFRDRFLTAYGSTPHPSNG